MTLADLRATVVKVERPGSGDDTRWWGPPWTASSSSYFESVNRSKYSVTLDLSVDGDRSAARELAQRADVVVENFRPGSLAPHDLDYDSVAAGNPGVVYCSISGFGPGKGATRPGYDFLVQAVGGLMSITATPTAKRPRSGSRSSTCSPARMQSSASSPCASGADAVTTSRSICSEPARRTCQSGRGLPDHGEAAPSDGQPAPLDHAL